MSLPIYTERYDELSTGGQPFVVVTVVDTTGSAPTDAGSRMLVTAAGIEAGSVGGGARRSESDWRSPSVACREEGDTVR